MFHSLRFSWVVRSVVAPQHSASLASVPRVDALRRKLLWWAVTYRRMSGNIVIELPILGEVPEEVIMKEAVLARISDFATHQKICLFLSLLILCAIRVEAKDTQPNILFIVADNQPASILGTYGNPDVKTPNIDRLANEGLRFTHAFAVHGMCSPTRATLLTGLLPSQHGVQDWLDDGEMEDWPSDWNAI